MGWLFHNLLIQRNAWVMMFRKISKDMLKPVKAWEKTLIPFFIIWYSLNMKKYLGRNESMYLKKYERFDKSVISIFWFLYVLSKVILSM